MSEKKQVRISKVVTIKTVQKLQTEISDEYLEADAIWNISWYITEEIAVLRYLIWDQTNAVGQVKFYNMEKMFHYLRQMQMAK